MYADPNFSVASSCGNPGITARAFANVSDVLGAMAHGEGGLRSGPALNHQWAPALKHLEVHVYVHEPDMTKFAFFLFCVVVFQAGNIEQGVAALAAERSKWLDSPTRMTRAARHYEGAAQILIRHAVMTAKQVLATQ